MLWINSKYFNGYCFRRLFSFVRYNFQIKNKLTETIQLWHQSSNYLSEVPFEFLITLTACVAHISKSHFTYFHQIKDKISGSAGKTLASTSESDIVEAE